jgi:hypothetical protein
MNIKFYIIAIITITKGVSKGGVNNYKNVYNCDKDEVN